MAKVTVFTSARMKQIEDKSVVSGLVDAQGNLILKTRDNTSIDAGSVRSEEPGPPGPPGGVDSVNGRRGAVSLTATDVGLPNANSRLGGSAVAVSFENNSQTKIPNRTDVIPSGWSKIGDADSAISFDSSNKRFTTSVPGLYFINFSGSYGNGTPVGNYEYRILKNNTRVLAFYGSADVSSRSGSVVVSLETTDYINLEYYQSSGSEFIIRQSSFNVVSFLRIV